MSDVVERRSACNYVYGRVIKCEAITDETLYFGENLEGQCLPDVVKENFNEASSVVVKLETISDIDQLFSCESLNGQKSPLINRVKLPLNREDKGKRFSCHLCNKSYKHRSSLCVHDKKHRGIPTGITERVTCKICGKSVANQQVLVVHLRTHTGEKPYKCEICNWRFTQKGDLTSHVRTHTGEKPFQCKVCDKSFRTSGLLNLHMKAHSRKRSYCCAYCDKSFIHKRNLRQHESAHTNEDLFQCSECKLRFSRKDSLRKHMKRLLHM